MVGWAIVRLVSGTDLQAESADWHLLAESSFSGLALLYLVARSFTSGTTALTGVEAISNGVPAFKTPKSKNAATTLLMLGVISMTMFACITWLALETGRESSPSTTPTSSVLPAGETQKTVIAQIANAVFSNAPALAVIVPAATALILVLAANTAFNGFPVLGSILARDGYLPRQLHTRGDRLAFSNGIIACLGRRSRSSSSSTRTCPTHPAVHRWRVRLVHHEPDRNGEALDASPSVRARPQCAASDAAFSGHQLRRRWS